MSIQVMSEVWEHSTATGAELLVLLGLADRARNEDGVCWPGILDIARRARISERQAQRHIRALILKGELRKLEQGGRGLGDTNTYQVAVGKYQGVIHVTLQGDIGAKKGDIRRRPRVTPMTPEPSVLNRQIEPEVFVDPKTQRLRLVKRPGS